jgi:hypothetical protein
MNTPIIFTPSKSTHTHLPKKFGISFPNKGCGIAHSHKVRKQKKFSQTHGKMKAGCTAGWRQRAICRRGRSYQWPEYPSILGTLGKGKAAN